MKWNLFCFHMLEEPPVLLRISYNDHRFKTFRCCGSSASLPFSASRSQAAISAHPLPSIRSLALHSLPFILPMSQILLKTDECLHPGNMPVVLGGNFPQHSRHTVYICHFLFSPPFEGSRGGGFMLENFTCTPQIFIPSSVTSHLQNEKVILNTIVFSF